MGTKVLASILAIIAAAVIAAPSALADCGMKHGQEETHGEMKDIVDTAVAAGSFGTLATALTEAGLVEALKGEGPFTVFAPTDDAFAKLPEGTVETLLMPENRDQLVAILTYHVVPGKVMAKQVVDLDAAATLNGQRVDIISDEAGVMIDKAKLVKADVEASNGVIHVIDTVLMPVSGTIVDVAADAGAFGTLLAAAKAAGLAEALMGEDEFTVFAPTDDAFAALPEGTVESLLEKENLDKLQTILKYHVVSGRVYSDAVLEAKTVTTIAGMEVNVSVVDGKAMANESAIVKTDIDASNGVIHVIDAVLLPAM
jgi:uncharacterized surface protein with fasciclin (FAS1) repeats